MPPQEAAQLVAVLAATKLLERIPVVKVLDEVLGKFKGVIQNWARKWFLRPRLQPAGGASVDWQLDEHDRDIRHFAKTDEFTAVQDSGSKKDKAWDRFEREDPLPGSVGVSKTNSLFKEVLDMAYKEDRSRVQTFGIPDDMVIQDGRITIVEEAKMYSKKDFERLAELAKENPKQFVREGVPAANDPRQKRFIQLIKHKRSVNYLLNHLDRLKLAKELGITRSDSDVVYMLKVPKHAPEKALNVIKETFEKTLQIKVKIRKIDW
ncbi:hypothetical protein JQC72_04640 [Polycladomyces sp. WAk]|uniref:Uncharacterized protein n=1 Tax=Polycladomyces zharkentensis TaxID=2807616 RepID=A0ABS2WH96_9BACL|nr:hypothetical protein [Polycladomyces sp. WAk]MBN2908810.1 hypothetical protein [Polycladomyces sp. WAk]